MRNDFGTRPYKSRFPYDKGGKSGAKKQGYNARLDESLGARRGAESTNLKATKLEETNLKAWKKLWDVEHTLLSALWIKTIGENNYGKYKKNEST